MSDSVQPHRWQPSRFPCPWDSPGKSTGVGCHCLLWWKSLSWVWFFATPWTVALQAPLSTGFSRQEYWSGLPFPSPGDLPDPGIKPKSCTLQADSLTVSHQGSPTCPPLPPPPNIRQVNRLKFLHSHTNVVISMDMLVVHSCMHKHFFNHTDIFLLTHLHLKRLTHSFSHTDTAI